MRIVTRLAWHLRQNEKKKTADFVPAPQVADTPVLVLECDADFAEHPVHLFTTPLYYTSLLHLSLSLSLSLLFLALSHVYIFLHIRANAHEFVLFAFPGGSHTYTYTQTHVNLCFAHTQEAEGELRKQVDLFINQLRS